MAQALPTPAVVAPPSISADEDVESSLLKRAVQDWAAREAQREKARGDTVHAQALLADVETERDRAVCRRRTAPQFLLPSIPDFAHNTAAEEAVAAVKATLSANNAGDPLVTGKMPVNSGENNKLAGQALLLAEALCHPQSPYAGNPSLIAPLLDRFEALYEPLVPGSGRLADFGSSPLVTQMYWMVDSVYPDLIPPSKQEQWSAAIRTNADAVATLRGPTFRAGAPGSAYLNADIKYIATLLYAGRMYNRSDYADLAARGLALDATALYPDGGFAYIDDQNECFTYHGINIDQLARIWLVSGDPLARSLIVRTRNYYPLSIEPPGVAEYATSPSWKHYWNTNTGSTQARIVADLAQDAQDARIGRMSGASDDFVTASFWPQNITPAPTPDDYIVSDANTLGARGRFGRYSFSSTTRRCGELDDRGSATFVGCMALDPPTAASPAKGVPSWPLSAALDSALVELTTLTAAENASGHGIADKTFDLARVDTAALTVARAFSALSTSYRLSGYRAKPLACGARQQWLLTPERMVGYLEIAPRQDLALAAEGALRLVCGRGSWGRAQQFRVLDPSTVQYGDLVMHFWANDFGPIQTNSTSIWGDAADGKSGEVHLRAPGPATRGSRHSFLVEVRPAWEKAATAVSLEHPKQSLSLLRVEEGPHAYTLVTNISGDAAAYLPTRSYSAAFLHLSGERYRPAWIEADRQPRCEAPPRRLTAADLRDGIVLQPGSQVVLSDRE